ncbi:MAG: AraC family transcriptional regulator, partial [Aeromonas sp.]
MPNRYRDLAAKVIRHVTAPGITPSPIDQVNVIYTTEHHGRTPVLYQPRMIVILQGHKVGYLADQVFRYDPNHYLLMTLPLPCECESFASPEQPLVGFSIEIDMVTLQALLLELGDALPAAPLQQSGVHSVPLSQAMFCAAERLIDLMDNPLHAKVLGP